jgi:hypothetical protein
MRVLLLLLICCCALRAETKVWERGSIFPDWQAVAPTRILSHAYNPAADAVGNGAALAEAIATLQPGDRLEIAAGTYSVDRWWNVALNGSAEAPIWICAAEGAQVVLTRPDSKQNVLNLAAQGSCSYLCLRGLEFTGGSSLLRLYACRQIWIDACYLHDGNNVGITANSANTDHLYLTRNRIERPGSGDATAEGMYLGGNDGSVVMRDSVIAFNRIRDCQGSQGDGIEIKQGSFDNWIIGNVIDNCHYPCLTIYGSQGAGINLVEDNVCWNSADNAIQIQGDAIVRNNLAMAAKGAAFYTRDHQGQVQNLQVINNTFINRGSAAELRNWSGRPGMVFANNACYSSDGSAIRIVDGSDGAEIRGNVHFGALDGFEGGTRKSPGGLADFLAVSVDGSQRDARPAPGSLLDSAADPAYLVPLDAFGLKRPSNGVGAAGQLSRTLSPLADPTGQLGELSAEWRYRAFLPKTR